MTVIRVARAALVVAGALLLAGVAGAAEAQRSTPRPAVGTIPPSRRDGDRGERRSGMSDGSDIRARNEAGWQRHSQRRRYDSPITVIYLPSDADAGYVTAQQPVVAYQQGVYYSPGGYVDTYGRTMSGGVGTMGPMSGAPGYTPDLSGSPYVVIAGGVMVADLPSGERRSFTSCAALEASRDPDGRPRTVFYQPTEYGLVLRDGQRGRVQGTPPAGTNACYGVDSFGRVALQY